MQVELLNQGSQELNFQGQNLKLFEKNLEHFWSKFAPPEFRLIKYRH